MLKKTRKNELRLRRHARVRRIVSGTFDCPRLNVFRSNAQIYAQVIDDTTGKTLVSSSSLVLKLRRKSVRILRPSVWRRRLRQYVLTAAAISIMVVCWL